MARVITDLLDSTTARFPDRTAYVDPNRSITFRELQTEGFHLASVLIHSGFFRKHMAIFMEKCCEVPAVYAGVAYSGNAYCHLDTDMPKERIFKIFQKLEPSAVITDQAHAAAAREIAGQIPVIIYEEAMKAEYDEAEIRRTTDRVLNTDILFFVFTSGSTGMPKGVILNHIGVIDHADWAADFFHFDENVVFGNQTPLYYVMSVMDVFQPWRVGCSTHFIDSHLFLMPTGLMEYLAEHKVTTLDWVPSALVMVSALGLLKQRPVPSLKHILFGGEMMPVKHINRWREAYPDVLFLNGYGPTEVIDTVTVYVLDREFADDDILPIGKSIVNKEVFLLDENDQLITPDQVGVLGEIIMRGAGVCPGYYNDPEQTRRAFIQNPLNTAYPETVYRSGDLARYNEYGELVLVCRKDFQIKHMGRRIELGEIETVCSSVEEVRENCCLFQKEKERLTLFYTGDIEEKALGERLKTLLPDYMLPKKRVHMDEMPHNLNGKIDRVKLKEFLTK